MIDAPTRPGKLALCVAQVSDAGGRESNQDALGSAQDDALAAFVVADGAGGHEGGEIASAIVVRSVIAGFERAAAAGASCDAAALQSSIAHAAAEVARGKAGIERLQSMSATVAAVMIDKEQRRIAWGHLGDTRIHLFRAGRLLHMTKDHSLVQQFIDAGLAGGADTRTHPKRNVLYAAIGVEGDVSPAIQPPIALQEGDAILVCTDGLWEWVDEAAMERSLACAADVHEWLAALCAAAAGNSAASAKTRDNFTAQAIWVQEERAAISGSSPRIGQRTP